MLAKTLFVCTILVDRNSEHALKAHQFLVIPQTICIDDGQLFSIGNNSLRVGHFAADFAIYELLR